MFVNLCEQIYSRKEAIFLNIYIETQRRKSLCFFLFSIEHCDSN